MIVSVIISLRIAAIKPNLLIFPNYYADLVTNASSFDLLFNFLMEIIPFTNRNLGKK